MDSSFLNIDFRSKRVWFAFGLSIFIFSIYSFYIRDSLLIGPLSQIERNDLSDIIKSSKQLRNRIGVISTIEFSEGMFEAGRNRYLYTVILHSGKNLISAQLRIKKHKSEWVDVYLVNVSPNLDESFSINLLKDAEN